FLNAQLKGRPVIADTGHTFRVRSTIDMAYDPVKFPAGLIGRPGMGRDGQVQYPNFVWDPIVPGDIGPMFRIQHTGANLHNIHVENIRAAGRDIAEKLFQIVPVSRNVIVAATAGDKGAISIEVSGARIHFDNVRGDDLGGGLLYTTAQGAFTFRDTFLDNALQAEPLKNRYFMHFDGAGSPADYMTFIKLEGQTRLEINSDMRDSIP